MRLILLITFLLAFGVTGCGPGERTLSVESVWARPASAGANTAVYFLIKNPGSQPARLLAVQSEISGSSEIHQSSITGNQIARMEPRSFVDVPPRNEIRFEPGGLHVMLLDLERPIQEADRFDLTLTFEVQGELTVPVTVGQP